MFVSIDALMFFAGAGLLCTLALGARYFQFSSSNLSQNQYLILLACATLIPRIVWVQSVHTIPVADFLEYHNYAVKVATGHILDYTKTMMVFPFKFFYPIFLGFFYALLTPSPLVAQYINIVLSAILSYQIYRIGVMSGGEWVGRLAGLFFAFWPSQIAFCSTLGQEHLFLVFALAAIYWLLRLEFINTTRGWIITSCLVGCSIAIAHVLRPVGMILFPTFLLAVIWGLQKVSKDWSFRSSIMLATLAGFAVTFSLLTIPLGRYLNYPVWKSSAGFSLYVGTSPKANGYWTRELTAIIREHHHNFDSVHAACMAEAKKVVLTQPVQTSVLAATKFLLFWGSDDYGVYFSTDQQAPSSSAVAIYRNRQSLTVFSAGAYFFLLASAAAGCWKMRSTRSMALMIVQSIFLLHVAAFSLLEIQSRYHFLVVPLLMIPAAMYWLPMSKRNVHS